MELAMIGLGRMEANMTTRLLRGGHHVVPCDLNEASIQKAEGQGAEGPRTLDELVAKFTAPQAVWVMLPTGNPTLDGITAFVPDSGEGRWTVVESIDLDCSIPVISMVLEPRFRRREEAPFGDKLPSAMYGQFGGHAVKTD